MKNSFFTFCFILILSTTGFSHRQNVHQRIVIESYNLLKLWMGNQNIPIMQNKIGDYSNIGENPWEQGFLTTGAWREDTEDIVYHYSLNNPPEISGLVGNLVQALGWALGLDNDDGYLSISHFWNSDAGDLTNAQLEGCITIGGIDNTFVISVPNAYQKMLSYKNGNFDLRIQLIIRDFPNGNGGSCSEQWAWVNFRYGYLPDYYKNKILRVSKIEWLDGTTTYYPNLPVFQSNHYSLLNTSSYDSFKENVCWEILGRMCHLLQDMGSPAHSNLDPHGSSGLRHDSFEEYFGDIGWTGAMVYNQNPTILNPFISSNPIHFLFYTTNQQANHFASNGAHMYPNNDYFGGDFSTEETNYLNSLNISSYGQPTVMMENIPSYQIENEKNKLFPQIIRATAGLLYWFARESNLIERITIKNSFNAGTIMFDQGIYTSGDNCELVPGYTHIITAIPQTSGNIEYVWNTTEPYSKSSWSKYDENGIQVNISNNLDINYNFLGAPDDNNATYVAGLKKNYSIRRDDQTEFDGTIHYVEPFWHVVEGNSREISAPGSLSTDGKTYTYCFWTDQLYIPNPRFVSPSSNSTYTAFYKFEQHSDEQGAYSKNSQRKFVRTENGILHNVYESKGRVWYEISTDNGVTWHLSNNSKPLDNGAGKSPSITMGYSNTIAIAFQQSSTGGHYSIELKGFYNVGNSYVRNLNETIVTEDSDNYTTNADPVVCWGNGADITKIIILWKNQNHLKYEGGIIGINSSISSYTPNDEGIITLSGTDASAQSPSIAYEAGHFYCTWQQHSATGNINIYFKTIAFYQNYDGGGDEPWVWATLQSSMQNISNGDGYSNRSNPSIIVMDDHSARIVWRASRTYYPDGGGISPFQQTTIIFRNTDEAGFSQFGSNVGNPNINRADNTSFFAFAWSEGDGAINKFADNTLSTYWIMPHNTGKDVQISNGPNKFSMFAESFNSDVAPFYFNTSASLGTMQYETIIPGSDGPAIGREGTISAQHAQFFFNFGDIIVDDRSIGFIPLPQHPSYDSVDVLNEYSLTEPFDIYDGIDFMYTILYGITDSSGAAALLVDGKYVSNNLYLIDDATGEVIAPLDNVVFEEGNIFQYANVRYQLETTGLGNGRVRMKLVTANNFEAEYSLNESYTDGSEALEKSLIKKKKAITTITKYAISQNFPNPFNPTTKINYQIPQTGFVKLKIYDILGKEVASLVNEEKNPGRYSVNFDASKLASGVYIYQLRVNNYLSSKKMLLLK